MNHKKRGKAMNNLKHNQKTGLLLIVTMMICMLCAGGVLAADSVSLQTATQTSKGYTYTLSETTGKAVLVSVDATALKDGVAILPESVTFSGETYEVTAIGPNALGSVTLKSVVIPDSITDIDASAFVKADEAKPSPTVTVTPTVTGTSVLAGNETTIDSASGQSTVDATPTVEESYSFDMYCNSGSAAESFATAHNITCHTDSFTIEVDKNTVTAGTTATASVTAKPSFSSDKDTITWKSSDTKIATVDDKDVITGVSPGKTIVTADMNGLKASVSVTVISENQTISLKDVQKTFSYSAHVQNKGWMDSVALGKTAGTTGKGLQMEGIKIATGLDTNLLGVSYQAHVQNVGWQDEVANGNVAGTEGKGLRMEAIKINLTGTEAQYFDIYYRVHVQNYGWLDWAKNGAEAGTQGLGYRIEAIEIQIVDKGDTAPGKTARPFINTSSFTNASVNYTTHVQGYGWQTEKKDGETAGTIGEGLRLEGIKISAPADNLPGESAISYRTHVQNIGWQSWSSNGNLSGTTGRSLRLEAIQIQLDSPLNTAYDVYYRVHVQNYGWLDWAKNGESAGTAGLGYRMEAIEIQLVAKGGAAPGSTSRPFIDPNVILQNSAVNYQAHVQDVGWQNWFANGATAGTTGQGKRVEAFLANLSGMLAGNSSISYQAYVEDTGWQGWRGQNEVAGTMGLGKRVEAFQFNLNGMAANLFDVYYQAHVENYGWLGWAKNGEWAGTMDGSLRIEAFNVVLVPKGAAAPGSTESHFIKIIKPAPLDYGWMPLSPTCICIDIDNQTLAGYVDGQRVVLTPVVTGTANGSLDTPRGDFVVNSKESPSVLIGPGYAAPVNYWMPFVGNDIGIHDSTWRTSGYGGNIYLTNGSHGCVNTPLDAMADIYAIFPVGTPVYVR